GALARRPSSPNSRGDTWRGGQSMSSRYAFQKRDPGVHTPTFARIILACLGLVDLVRGVLHTFFVEHSAVEIAGLNLAHSGQDQLLLLGAFGISNFLTGAIFIAVALKARQLVPTVLAIIPAAYLLGFVAFRLNDIAPEAAFPGRKFMLAYAS